MQSNDWHQLVSPHQLIEAADVVERLGTIVPNLLPANEGQARELHGLPTETRRTGQDA